MGLALSPIYYILVLTAYGCKDNFDYLDTIFVLDSSSSASEEVFLKMKTFVVGLISQLKIGKKYTSVSVM